MVQTLHNYRLFCLSATLYRDGHICEYCLRTTLPWPSVASRCHHGSSTHSGVVAGFITLNRWLKNWQQQVDQYVALTQFLRSKFVRGGLPPDKVVVKHNFVFADAGNWAGKRRHALFLGPLSVGKGLSASGRGWYGMRIPLKIVGDAPVAEHDGLGSIELLGRRRHEDVLDLMRDACFLVFPSGR